jgi:WD40 repeat protein
LLNAPPLGEIVRNWLQILSRQTLTALPESLDEQLRLLLSYLQQERCLLVLDNVESIFAADESKSRAGVTRPGYEGYDQLFQRLASSDHQSCLLLTSREQPYALLRSGRQAQTTGRVQVLPLAGLDQTAGQVLLTSNGLNTSAAEAAQLVENYSGNPLALQIVAATIADFFGGDVAAFQQEEGQLFDGMRLVLDQQFARLSPLEREILVWLAIEREAITVPMLRSNFVQPQPGARTAPLLEALQALQNRSLLEKRDAGFALQNVIIEYTTEYLVEQVCREISEDKLTRLALTGWQGDKGTESSSHPVTQSFLNRFALLKADAKEYVRQSQMRLILQPLAERLLAQQSKKQVVVQINRLLAALRATVVRSGYAGGNLLNLLVHLGEDLTNVDFSHLAVWQADLRGVMFAALDFTNADLTHTAFTSAIDTGVVQFLPTGELLIADTSGGDLCLSRMIDGQLVDAFRQAGQSRRPLSFSADGATIVTAGTDYALHVWSTANGVCELTLPGHNGMIYALATSADGTLFASGGADRVVCLWDRQRGQLRQRLTGYEKGIDALAFTPDGRILATGGGDGLVRLWDTQSAVSDGSLLATLYGHTHAIGALAFSPDGRWLASGSHDGVICLWDRQQLGSDGTPTMQRWQGHSSIVRALLFQPASPTATAVAALGEVTAPLLLASGSSDQSIRLWSLAGELRYTLLGHTHEIRSLTFSADGRQLASSGTDQRVYWWDPQTGQAINSLQAYRYGVNCARFSPDGALVVSGSADRLVRLWPVASQVAAEADDSPICHSLRGHTRFVRAVAVSPSGRIVASGGPDRTVRLWDTTTRAERQILTGHTGHVLTLAFTRAAAAALLASAGADRTIRLWSIQEGQPLPVPSPRLLLGHEDEIHTLAFDRTGRTLASGCMDGSVRVWDVASGVTRLRLPGHTAPITMVAISPDGSTLASIAFDQTLRLWDLTTGECLQSKKDEHVGTRAVAFGNHPDVGGEFLAYDGDDFAIYVWPWRTGAPAFALRGHSGTIMTLDCSVTAPLLVSGGMDGTLGLWDLATRRCRQLLRAPGPYAGMKISGVTGISAAQKAALKALGAADEAEDDRVTNDKVTESPSHPVTLSPLKNPSKAVTQSPPHLVTPAPLLDWAEMPMVDFFVERTAEVAQLTAWLTPSAAGGVPAQLISILGMGGMGKTTLAAAVTKAVARTFAVVIWRSLLNAPPLGEIVRNWLQILSRQNLTALPESLDEQLRLLLNYLQQERCLLILDNVESIFAADESKSRAGVTRPGYEGYDQLFQRLASSDHQSCLLLTSREQPYALLRSGRQAQTAGRLQVLSLAGLDQTAGQVLLTSNGLNTSAAEAAQLVENYSGNPLALQIVAATITDFFGGDVAAFQQEEGNLFDGLRLVLDQQFARLSPLERDILVWLAIEREPVTVPMLRSNFVHPVTTAPLLEALQALQNRSLLEKRDSGLTLQNVIIEYTTEYLVTQVCEEILDFRFWILDSGPDESPVTIQNPKSKIQNLFLNRFALLKAQAKAYVRQSQSRFIVEPVVTRLRNRLGQADLTQQTRALITTLQQRPDPGERGYAAGNLLNLLIAAGVELTGYDLAGLTIWQAFLRTCTLYDVNFAGADLTGSEFADTFATITALTYSRDGRFLLGSASIGDIRVWLANTLQPVGMLQGHSRIVMGLAVGSAASQLLASCGEDGTVRLWDLATLDNPGLILYKTTGFVCTVAISPLADLVASAGDDPAIQVWDAGTRRQVAILRGHTHTVTAVAFSPDGRYLASCSGDHTVRLWDVSAIYQPAPVAPHLIDNSQIIYQWPPGAEDVWQITISPDGQWLAGVQRDGTLWRWQIDAALSNKPVQILQKQGVHHSTLRFSGDSSLLAVASQAKTIWLLDSHSGEVVQQLEGHTQLTNALAFSPDGKTLASSGSDRVLRVWELATGRAIQSVAGAARSFRDAVFAADGQTLVTCGADRTIRIWEITEAPAVATGTVTITGHCRHTLQGHSSGIWTVAVDTTSQVVASAGEDCNILLWERSTGRLLHKLQGHRYTVTALAFSPDGQTLVSGSPDQTVRLWNYRSYRPLVELRDDSQSTSVHEQSIWCVALSPDGATVAAGYSDGSIVLWDIRDPTHCRQIGKLRKHAGWVRKVAFSPDGTLLASGSNDQTVRIWDVVTGQLRAECKGHTDWVMSLTFHPDGQRLASAGYDNTIRLWDVATGKPVAPASVTTPVTDPTPMRHNKGVMAVTFHPQGHLLLSASQDERMIFWQVANQQKVQSLIAPGPYSGLNITGVTGLSEAQKAALRALGAVEE